MRLRDKVRRGEKGFTLVELLIVVTILGILVAVVMANFPGLLSGAQTNAAAAELQIVQTAVDAKMAAVGDSSVTAVGTATNNMDTLYTLYTDGYMREQTSKCFYFMATTGEVSQQANCFP
jgi:prepilin-type N-terminal cleavage/methylation domain-containing protein